jgi:hypothetical protein
MARYRLIADIFVNNVLLEMGSIVSDTGPGAQLPANYVPSSACDPLDNDGIQKLWNAGPREMGRANSSPALGNWGTQGHWSNVPIAAPLVHWKPFQTPNTNNLWILTGAGGALGPVQGTG